MIMVSDNSLSSVQHQVDIMWTSAGLLLIEVLAAILRDVNI